jgi:lipoprotein-anchoring transpeptidase ErfK/SrfK
MKPAITALLLALALPSAALAQDPAATPTPTPTPVPEERIRAGVHAVGVDVGGLTVAEATALPPRKVRFSFDAQRTAQRALEAGKAAPAPSGGAGGTAADVDVAPIVKFRRKAIRSFAVKVAKAVYVQPRDATVKITLRRVKGKASKAGRRLVVKDARKRVEAAFADPRLPRVIKPGREKVPAKVKYSDLKRIYHTVITVDRNNFRLRLFKALKLSKSYGIAVGAPGYPTPTGRYSITNKAVNPVWTAPNSPWAGEFAGQSIPGGSASNPLKARWMGIVNGVGIHGTGAEYSIGTRASHGCIRMRVADVIDLYPRVPIGTPVLIK